MTIPRIRTYYCPESGPAVRLELPITSAYALDWLARFGALPRGPVLEV